MKKLILTFMFLFLTTPVFANGYCTFEESIYNKETQTIQKNIMRINFKFFKTQKEAQKYAIENSFQDNIITDKELGFYVFDYLPDSVFTCIYFN